LANRKTKFFMPQHLKG